MKRNWLKSTTALAVVIGLATPHGAIAQSAENSTTGITLEGEAEANTEASTNAETLGEALGQTKDEEEEAQNEPVEEAETEQAQDNAAEQGTAEEAENLREKLETKADADEVTDEALDNAGEVAEQASDTAEEATENAEEIVDEATETADEATDSAQDTAEEATESAQDTAEQAQENVEEAVEEAQENVQESTEEAQETAEDTADQAEETTEQAEGDTAADELRNALGLDGNADAEAEADAEADATATGTADADADVDADANAEADANADAGDTTDADASADADATAEATAEVDEEVVEEALEKAERDDVEQLSAEEQAQQAAQTAADTGAAALSGVGELLDRTQETVTEEQARSSSEEFDTDLSDQERIKANMEKAARAKALADANDDDDDLAAVLGAAAVGVLGAYMVGQSFEGGGQVVSNTGDRIVIEDGGQYRVIRDDNALLRRPGSTVETETYSDGSTRTIIDHEDGSRVVTVRSSNGAILQRVLIRPDGQEIVLIDDTRDYTEVDVTRLQQNQAQTIDYDPGQTDQLRTALAAQGGVDRAYSLNQVRNINVVRSQVPVISLDSINFDTNSAVIRPEEAEELQALGDAMREAIEEDPQQLFLVEGHTDTVGRAAYNLALSDRRAESVALALTEYFNVPPANMIVQGYGESDLKVQQAGDIRENRRAAVRNITPLLNGG